MFDYKNLSDGDSDGIVLFYMKDKKLYPIRITSDQAGMLDLSLPIAFNCENGLKLAKEPIDLKWVKPYCC